MIAKHVPMTSANKSDFAGLVTYITSLQGKDERIGIVRVTNCHSEQAKVAMLEVLNTQALNTRATADKTYHLIVSFRAGEMPDDATLGAIEERLCAGLGFDGHQRVSVVHHDTDNLHIHIAINKIHPSHYTMHEPFNAYHTLGQLCDRLENDYGLEKDNHKASKVGSENRASDMERHAAVESLLGWIKRECKDKIQAAHSWEALHQVMHEHGLRLHEHGNGLAITSESGVSVKASSVSREFSKARLEARLGGFTLPPTQIHDVKPRKTYNKQPMRSRFNTVELHARYKAAQQLATTARASEWNKAIARKKRLIEDAKRHGRLKRAAIRLARAPAVGKKLMYAATSRTLLNDIAAINRQYLKKRQEIHEKYQRRAWGDWLRTEATAGDREALAALRGRENATGLTGNTLERQGGAEDFTPAFNHDSITKKGTIIYCVGASAVRDDGDKIKVSRGADQAGLAAALRMAVGRFGTHITVNGTAAFKEEIARTAVAINLPINFDDEGLKRQHQQMSHKVKPMENPYGNDSSAESAVKRRPDHGGDGGSGKAAASRASGSTARSGAFEYRQHAARSNKPDARSAGQSPPPKARHGLRGLSELSVVHVTDGGELLLPGHVPDHLEHKRTKPDDGLRRDIHRPGRVRTDGRTAKAQADGRSNSNHAAAAPFAGMAPVKAMPLSCKPNVGRVGRTPPPLCKDRLYRLSQLGAIVIGDTGAQPLNSPQTPAARSAPPLHRETSKPAIAGSQTPSAPQAAANKYIAEREKKRTEGLAIPTHVRFMQASDATAEYCGMRRIDGQALALLKLGREVAVLAVDDTTATFLKRLRVGQQLSVTAKGAIKTKGRSR